MRMVGRADLGAAGGVNHVAWGGRGTIGIGQWVARLEEVRLETPPRRFDFAGDAKLSFLFL
jgi:hypothetical protein